MLNTQQLSGWDHSQGCLLQSYWELGNTTARDNWLCSTKKTGQRCILSSVWKHLLIAAWLLGLLRNFSFRLGMPASVRNKPQLRRAEPGFPAPAHGQVGLLHWWTSLVLLQSTDIALFLSMWLKPDFEKLFSASLLKCEIHLLVGTVKKILIVIFSFSNFILSFRSCVLLH